ncbi:hypothetical protein ACFL1N_04695 [Thermodesulfobacteriota bacterium]
MMKGKIIIILIMFLAADLSFAQEKEEEESYWEIIKNKIEELKSDNLEKSEKAKNWIEEDLKKIGDWEYKVLKISTAETEEIEKKLNQLGNDRWECFWLEKRKDEIVFYFKRNKISYLQKIPSGELLKIFDSL